MSFGNRWPSNDRRSGQKKKNLLGETVTPSVKGPFPNDRVVPSIKQAHPSVLGNVTAPRIIGPRPNDRVEPRIKRPDPAEAYKPPIVSSPIPSSAIPVDRSGIAIVGRFTPWPWKQYPNEAYLADALEALSLKVVRIPQDLYVPPDMSVECALFTAHPASFSRLERWNRTHPTILWTPNLVPGFPEYEPVLEAARKASLFLSGDKFDWKGVSGFTHHAYFPSACDPRMSELAPRPEISCAFIGTVYSERRRRIVSLVKKFGGTVLDQMPLWRYGSELSEFVQTVKVVVGDNARNDVPGYWSARNYIVPGAGGFLLAPRVEGLEHDFALNHELAVYDSEDELESRIKQWIDDDLGRESIRLAGRERVHRDHTWKVRAKSFLMLLSEKVK